MRFASQRYGQIQLIKELWLRILLYIGGEVKIFMDSRVSLQWKRLEYTTVYTKAKEMDS